MRSLGRRYGNGDAALVGRSPLLCRLVEGYAS